MVDAEITLLGIINRLCSAPSIFWDIEKFGYKYMEEKNIFLIVNN